MMPMLSHAWPLLAETEQTGRALIQVSGIRSGIWRAVNEGIIANAIHRG
jgi:hypothetical protein